MSSSSYSAAAAAAPGAGNPSLLRGSAVLIIWGSVDGYSDAKLERDLNDWWTYEHLPERLALPGFHRTRRYYRSSPPSSSSSSSNESHSNYMVLYEVSSLATLTSPEYMHALNNPTPRTRQYMPVLSSLSRSACRVLASMSRAEFAPCHVGGAGGTLAHVVLEAPAAAETRASLTNWLAHECWAMLCTHFSSLLAMHVLEPDEAATSAGSSTKSYDGVNFKQHQQDPKSSTLTSNAPEAMRPPQWMMLLEFADPFGAPFASYDHNCDEFAQGLADHGVDLSKVTEQFFGLFVVMEE
ncbi:uncharacterized protein Z520_10187 [Fonsecaea multimorphosa CBS 102226]|uniref:Uncharacterized protein n=1 Tax=Fonsecaea multimorphosa CBS 102226 TaxID=1442371 RepID=A0A0D2IAH8_9EURO|nr:uncharacterized protein Z520_10187 [Fonsecaea multimorphosa CBS 102226]KIX94161.1 hypothetical protein Z520_10187 [Fonsecaea multimorphosa CBS 102226]OAL19514.1 hypothetical protein AYO22_09676 [Fonsecaea multimorphosa]